MQDKNMIMDQLNSEYVYKSTIKSIFMLDLQKNHMLIKEIDKAKADKINHINDYS